MATFKEGVSRKKAALAASVERPMAALAVRCAKVWSEPDKLDQVLKRGLRRLSPCSLLYALRPDGIQISSNVGPGGIDLGRRGQDLAVRPYLGGPLPYRGLLLSSAYLSHQDMQPCITAMQAVTANGLLGFLMADFHLHDVPVRTALLEVPPAWRQFKGDPAIRGTLFQQQRAPSTMDQHLDQVLAITRALMLKHGVFHCKLHFSSSRATVWVADDPFNYRLHDVDEFVDPAVCLAYPKRPYPRRARVEGCDIAAALGQFKTLREADEAVYLRSASLNIMNGLVGLTFSCDGSHYMPVAEFINRDLAFWLGPGGAPQKQGTSDD